MEKYYVNTRWPHTYQNCVAGTCRGADQIKSNMPCVEMLYHKGGEEYKKFGANLKVRARGQASEDMTTVKGTCTVRQITINPRGLRGPSGNGVHREIDQSERNLPVKTVRRCLRQPLRKRLPCTCVTAASSTTSTSTCSSARHAQRCSEE